MRRWWADDHDFVATRVTELHRLHDSTIEFFRRVPYLKVRPAQATAYLFPDVSALGLPDHVVAGRLQHEARVIVSPGYQFGPAGVGHFRVCFAREETEWNHALGQMVDVLKALGKEQGLA
jgi:aspartate/methionine/tyrosine aminotransferase